MQTILGAGGVIGVELARVLPSYTDKIRLISRNPKTVNPSDELFPCDLTDEKKVREGIKGSEVAYLVAGLEYNTKVWQSTWPKIMRNVIESCKKENTKLVFFDNIYMYDAGHVPFMTEETPVNPSSAKGKVRAEIAAMLMDEVRAGNLKAVIVRAADFYGPGSASILMEVVYKNLKKGKKANWLCSVDHKHSFTFTPDAAKATAILGNDDKAFNQIWHLPTAANPLTGLEWINAFASALQVKARYSAAPAFVIKLIGLFNPIMKEMYEMLYQYDRDYIFDSSKFQRKYDFKPTLYEKAIQLIIEKDNS